MEFRHSVVVVGTVCMTVLVTIATADIFASSLKVERLAQQESAVLDELRRYIELQYERLKTFSSFYTDRVRDMSLRDGLGEFPDLHHPNAVFKTIQRFSADYAHVLGDNFESFRRSVASSKIPYEADVGDIRGASLSILRLQSVYQLRAADMAAGQYLGFSGPPLSTRDTYEIGQLAFTEGKLQMCIEWLNVTLKLMSSEGSGQYGHPTIGGVHALIGRAYLYGRDVPTATAYYEAAMKTHPTNGDAVTLGEEFTTKPVAAVEEEKDYFHNFSRLCSLENRHHVPHPFHPSMLCRYKEALLPYNRFAEEILSVAPFVSVFYNVTTDEEVEVLKDLVKYRLERGQVGDDQDTAISDVRTSDLAWIWDYETPVATEISHRIKHLTGLETDHNWPDGPASAEAFQVVNYGLGGHYAVHMDPFQNGSSIPILQDSGDRIATFLMYLSDVTRGGSTVFTMADIAVAPVKNMALFWYNFSPAYELDQMTHHAGCPVLIGHKWIANKWIWTAGNTFRRRCGLSPDATQLDIEADMGNNYS